MRAVVAVVLVLTTALAGCGGSSSKRGVDKNAEKQLRTVGQTPTFLCVEKATEKPLPVGSVVIGSETRSAGRVIVYAVSPHDVKSTLHSMQQMPAAGFKLTEGEVEERDAGSNWKATVIPGDGRSARCPTAPTRHRSPSSPRSSSEPVRRAARWT